MKLSELVKSGAKKQIVIGLIALIFLIALYFIAQISFPDFRFLAALKNIVSIYETAIAQEVSHILKFFNIEVYSENNEIYSNGILIGKILEEHLEFKWFAFLIASIWFVPANFFKKILSSVSTVAFFIIMNIVHFVLLFLIMGTPDEINSIRELLFTLIGFFYICWFAVWIIMNKAAIEKLAKKNGVDYPFLQKTFKNLILILIAAVIINNFILNYLLKFDDYQYFILRSAERILHLFNYETTLDYPYLSGEKGIVHFIKPCLGIKMLVTFVAFILLTGVDIKKRIIYSVIGLIILNLVNILRIVAIFIHLQTDLEQEASEQFHDYIRYFTYTLVFILWILWLERFSDIWPYIRKKKAA